MTDLTRDEYEELIVGDCAFLIGALDEGDQKKRIIDALRKSPEHLYGQTERVVLDTVFEHHKMRDELAETINRHCAENGSDTPDFILAEYLTGCLATYDRVLQAREPWYGRKLSMLGDAAQQHVDTEESPQDSPEGGPA